jgi:hypothetical protein
MKLNLILGGIAVAIAAIAVSVPIVREAQANKAAEEIVEDYKLCSQGYSLLGKAEQTAKLMGSKDEPRGLKEHLATLKSVERSCARYNDYLAKWGTFKIVPSEELVLALVSRYEPERLKQK